MKLLRIILINLLALSVCFQAEAASLISPAECEDLADAVSVKVASSNLHEDVKIRKLAQIEEYEWACKDTGRWPPTVFAFVNPVDVENEVQRTAVFTIQVSNDTSESMQISRITGVLPAPLKFVAINSASTIGTSDIVNGPNAGASGSLLFSLKPKFSIPARGTAILSFDADVPAAIGAGIYTSTFLVETPGQSVGPEPAILRVRQPQVSLDLRAIPVVFDAGKSNQKIDYELTVTNNTERKLKLIEIRDKSLGGDFKFNKDYEKDSRKYSNNEKAFRFNRYITLMPGVPEIVKYQVKVENSVNSTEHENIVTAIVGNFFAGNEQEFGPRYAKITASVKRSPNVTTSVDKAEVEAGTNPTVTFTIAVENRSSGPIVVTEITDILPKDFRFGRLDESGSIRSRDIKENGEPKPETNGEIKFALKGKTVQPNETATLKYAAEIKSPEHSTTYSNSPEVTFNDWGKQRPKDLANIYARFSQPPVVTISPPRATLKAGSDSAVTLVLTIKNESKDYSREISSIRNILSEGLEFKEFDKKSGIGPREFDNPAMLGTRHVDLELYPIKEIKPDSELQLIYLVTASDSKKEQEIEVLPEVKVVGVAKGKDWFKAKFPAKLTVTAPGSGNVEEASNADEPAAEVQDQQDQIVPDASEEVISRDEPDAEILPGDGETTRSTEISGENGAEQEVQSFVEEQGLRNKKPSTATATASPAFGLCEEQDINITPDLIPAYRTYVSGRGGTFTYRATIENNCTADVEISDVESVIDSSLRYAGINNIHGDVSYSDLRRVPDNGTTGRLAFAIEPLSSNHLIRAGETLRFAYNIEIAENTPPGEYPITFTARIDQKVISANYDRIVFVTGSEVNILQQIITYLLHIFWGSPWLWVLVAWFWVIIAGYFILYETGWAHVFSVTLFAVIMYGVSRFIGKTVTHPGGGGLGERLEVAVKDMYHDVLSVGIGSAIGFFIAFAVLVLLFYLISLLVRIFTGNFGDDTG